MTLPFAVSLAIEQSKPSSKPSPRQTSRVTTALLASICLSYLYISVNYCTRCFSGEEDQVCFMASILKATIDVRYHDRSFEHATSESLTPSGATRAFLCAPNIASALKSVSHQTLILLDLARSFPDSIVVHVDLPWRLTFQQLSVHLSLILLVISLRAISKFVYVFKARLSVPEFEYRLKARCNIH